MGIDTSIYNQLLRPPKSVAEYDAEAMQGQQNRLSLQMQQSQMDERQRGIADEQAMRGVVSKFGADKGANYNALLGSGRLKEAQAYEKSNVEISKEQRAAEKEQFILARDRYALLNNAIAGSTDQASYTMNRQQLAAHGLDVSQIPEQFDPTFITNAKQQALSEAQRIEQAWKEKGFDQEERKFTYQQENDLANRLLTKRGQDVSAGSAAASRAQSERASLRADERAREFNGTKVEENRIKRAEGKPLTEFQGKSAAFGDRAMAADVIIGKLDGKYRPSTINVKNSLENVPLFGGLLGTAANSLMDGTAQEAEQAQRDFINATLRQESGAAIGASEFDNARKQYFPQPGDNAGVIKQKAANRKLVIAGFKRSAGKNAGLTDAAPEPDDILSQADAILGGK
jgi:hypothetical protein